MDMRRFILGFIEGFRNTMREEGLEGYNRYYGLYRARVTNVDDPQGQDRIRVESFSLGLPEGQEELLAWAYPVGGAVTAGDGSGSSFTPCVGESVWIAFEFGDINQPLYYPGGWFAQGEIPPDLSGPEQRGFVTPVGHKFILRDDQGSEEVVLAHKDGQSVNLKSNQSLELVANGHSFTISTNSIEIVHQTGTRVDVTATSIDVDATASVSLKAPRVVLDGDVSVELGANGTDPVVKGNGLIAYLVQDLIWKSAHVHGPPGSPPLTPAPPFNLANLLSRLVRTK